VSVCVCVCVCAAHLPETQNKHTATHLGWEAVVGGGGHDHTQGAKNHWEEGSN